MNVIQNTLIRSLVLALVACGGGGQTDDRVAGPCYVSYDDPVLTIASATDSMSTGPIAQLTISSISVDGIALDLRALGTPISNAQVIGNSVQCTVPCGFSTQQGTYSATISAAGYQSAALSVTASYQTVTGGGCPAIYSGGKHTSVSLQPL
jgi:hypothetical protein